MAQLRARTPQIMRRYVGKPEFLAYCFTTCQTNRSVTPSPQCLPARQTHRNSLPVEISGCSHPQVDARFDTFGNRHDSNLAAFADQISYRRTFLTLLQMREVQVRQFAASESAAQQHGENCTIPLSSERVGAGNCQKRRASSAVSQFPTPHTQLLDTIHTPDTNREFRTE